MSQTGAKGSSSRMGHVKPLLAPVRSTTDSKGPYEPVLKARFPLVAGCLTRTEEAFSTIPKSLILNPSQPCGEDSFATSLYT
jgi:hypothetical protein